MAELVNLRRARKQRERDANRKSAEANRLAFGRTKAERQLTEARNALAEKRIEGHRREGSDRDDSTSDA